MRKTLSTLLGASVIATLAFSVSSANAETNAKITKNVAGALVLHALCDRESEMNTRAIGTLISQGTIDLAEVDVLSMTMLAEYSAIKGKNEELCDLAVAAYGKNGHAFPDLIIMEGSH